MDLTLKERDRRYLAAKDILERHDVDVAIAGSDFGDQSTLQRYFSNFRSSYDNQAVMVYRDGTSSICSTHPGGVPIAKMLSWTTDVHPMAFPETLVGSDSPVTAKGATVGGQIANQLNKRGLKRVGVIGMEYIPYGWLETIKAAVPGVTFVDVWDDFHLLRLTKSEEEVALIREAARISDLCWAEMPNIVKAGRKRYEVLADLEHIIRSNGCEDSFNMCMYLPMLQEKLDRSPYSALPIEEGKVYLIEVSPRYAGYYAQQTAPVSVGCDMPDEMLAAYNAVNHARAKAVELMKPGVDLVDVDPVVAETLKSDGFEAPSPSFGHAIGLELEDQHINGKSLVLKEGMTFIFHPFAVGHPAVMRADTYLITADGVERLTTGNIEPLHV